MPCSGHGTYMEGENVIASVAGVVEKVNKLLSVRSIHSRFHGEIGDVVVGRVRELGQKKWKVDINGRQDAILLLSSVNLPGGVQRRKSESDELQMRNFFAEGDLLSAEIQAFFHDGAVSLQTRNIKYGRLRNGSLVTVPPEMIKRSKSHFVTLPMGVSAILGLNGNVWVYATPTSEELNPYSTENDPIPDGLRSVIARVCNCVELLAHHRILVSEGSIHAAFQVSSNFGVADLLKPQIASQVAQETMVHIKSAMDTS